MRLIPTLALLILQLSDALSQRPGNGVDYHGLSFGDADLMSLHRRHVQETTSTASTTNTGNAGSDLCPCLSSDDLPMEVQAGIVNHYMFTDRDIRKDGNMFLPGQQCGFHHQAEAICKPENNDCTSKEDKSSKNGNLEYPYSNFITNYDYCIEPECNLQFCIVDPNNCNIAFLSTSYRVPADTILEGTTNATHPLAGTPLCISYATCGYLNPRFGSKRQKEVIDGTNNRTLRVALLDESAGWTGAYSSDGQHFVGPWQKWSGTTVSFIQKAALQGEFSLRLVDPSTEFEAQNLTLRAQEYYDGSKSAFDLCVYATSTGFVDLCIGDFTITDRRVFETEWIKLQTRYLRMAVPFTYNDNDVLDDLWTFVKPFQWQTWLFMLFFVVPVMAVLFFVFDDGQNSILLKYEPVATAIHKKNDDLEQSLDSGKPERRQSKKEDYEEHVELQYVPWYTRLGRTLSVTYLSLVTRSYNVQVVSLPSKINFYGMTIFLFGFGSTYFANLAAQLTVQQLSVPVSSFEEALLRNYRFCTTRKKYDVVRSFHPTIQPEQFVLDEVDGLPGFENHEGSVARELVLAQIDPVKAEAGDTSYCHAAILPDEDLEFFNSESKYCGIMTVGGNVAAEAIGIPISSARGRDLRMPYAFLVALENRGDFVKELVGGSPQSLCSADALLNSKDTGFSIRQMGGVWMVSFGFSFIAICVYVYEKGCKAKSTDDLGRPTRAVIPRTQWGLPLLKDNFTVQFMEKYTYKDKESSHRILKSPRQYTNLMNGGDVSIVGVNKKKTDDNQLKRNETQQADARVMEEFNL